MNKILIIISREYITRVKKKSFILLTVLMPFLMAALIATPILLGSIKDDEQQVIGVVDKTHLYEPLFRSTDRFLFDIRPEMTDEMRSDSSDLQAVICIEQNLCEHPEAVTIYSREEVQMELRRAVEDILNPEIRTQKLMAYNLPELPKIIDDVQGGISLQTVKWGKDGTESISSSDVAMVVGMMFTMLIYMFVMSYGGMVLSGVTEEKSSRIMEVMVCSVKPFQLMMGKIIGVFLVGLTQMVIWGSMLALILTGAALIAGGPELAENSNLLAQNAQLAPGAPLPADSSNIIAQGTELLGSIPFVELGVMFVLCFIGGYILYASIFAACGAAVDSQEDSSQFMMPIIILMIFGLYAAMGSIENTNGPLAFWASLFPFTSPVVLMIRIPFGIPLWQELLSIGLLYGTAIGFVWISARIYRVGILMYGKKPTFRELWKWLKQG